MVNLSLLDFFGKKPKDFNEWNSDSETLRITLGYFSEMIRENVRGGVLLAINDAFGKK